MTTQTKKMTVGLGIVAAVVVLGVALCAVVSIVTLRSLDDMKLTLGITSAATQEDDVPIMDGDYWIRSTTQISDAYLAGSDAGLSAQDKETLAMASEVLDEIITDDMTPYEKEKAVYDWMTTELTYDTGVLQVIPQTDADCDNPYGVLKYHNAVCVGYATTFRLLMQMMDIPCMVVHNNDLYHSWNLVQLDGEWYHVDVYSDQGNGNYACFNLTDDMLGQSWDRDFYPAATSLTYNYTVQNAADCEDLYGIPLRLRKALEDREGAVALRFAAIDEPHAQQVEEMLSGVQSFADSGEFGDLWMEWSWIHITGSEYVLSVRLNFYDEEPDERADISEEDQAKIEEALESAFGEEVDLDALAEAEDGATEAVEEFTWDE